MLQRLHRIERDFGRERRERWGSRSLDLDLLAAGDAVLPDQDTQTGWQTLPEEARARSAPPALILPHPRLQERGFVLVPLCDVAPDWRHPLLDATARTLRDALDSGARAEIAPCDPRAPCQELLHPLRNGLLINWQTGASMARVTVEDCVDKVPNRFELVMLAAHRAREISAGAVTTVERDNDKNPVVSLREIADETQSAEALRERLIESNQTQIEVDEPEDDAMALLMGAEQDKPQEDDLSEEKLLRALMEAQGQG